ncbi:uncharacterized protein A4U43_C04F20380 [Asparagus officinalis]|uniref:Uncharacterized protein n=1 Tax=Asparagus officinalis TaxID=4686 RepID=A0A5P1F795_ASPOF|nr:uncharacterized protein A4U43_C04F20380 [Asparagus officinalis]
MFAMIQDNTLTGSASSIDVSTEENLQNLVQIGKDLLKKPVSRLNLETGRYEVQIGKDLLKKPVSRLNLETGRYEPVDGEGTNEEALARFAECTGSK